MTQREQTFKIKIQNESPFVDEAQNILACALPYIDGVLFNPEQPT
jgi:hypothetical protein